MGSKESKDEYLIIKDSLGNKTQYKVIKEIKEAIIFDDRAETSRFYRVKDEFDNRVAT
jgi:hypothetical protein